MEGKSSCHIPVMVQEVVGQLLPMQPDSVFVDCTLGYGGHSAELIRGLNQYGRFIGIDRDAEAIAYCKTKFQSSECRVSLYHRAFDQLGTILEEEGIETADRYLFDLGFSSPQVDQGQRGFSFMREGPLDMRMDQRQPLTASDLIQHKTEKELSDLFKHLGEERFSRRIAKAIVRRRRVSPIETTQELADIVIQAIPARYRKHEGIHPATRVFQALRIAVNNELESLRTGLSTALHHLSHGGRIAVLSYHSLEHRIVKELFRGYCRPIIHPPGIPVMGREEIENGIILTRKAVRPCAAEQERNPRCRSAQLRVLERL